jgi:prepilin peptidase CpaA
MIVSLLTLATLSFFPALMAFSASSDIFSMKISNRVSIALAVFYPALALGLGVPLPAILANLACGAAMLCLTFLLFTRGWIGGGDAKLAAATAPWLGWALMLDYGLLASIAGGALTLAIVLARRAPLPAWAARLAWIARLHDPDNGVPYGVALAAAGLALYPSSHIWRAATGL